MPSINFSFQHFWNVVFNFIFGSFKGNMVFFSSIAWKIFLLDSGFLCIYSDWYLHSFLNLWLEFIYAFWKPFIYRLLKYCFRLILFFFFSLLRLLVIIANTSLLCPSYHYLTFFCFVLVLVSFSYLWLWVPRKISGYFWI